MPRRDDRWGGELPRYGDKIEPPRTVYHLEYVPNDAECVAKKEDHASRECLRIVKKGTRALMAPNGWMCRECAIAKGMDVL